MLCPNIGKPTIDVTIYENDPLVYRGKVTARLVTELFAAMSRVQDEAAKIRLPMLIMHGAEDTLTSVGGSKLLHERISSGDKQIIIYDGLHHEILNELERPTVVGDMLQWLEPRLPA